MTQSLRRVCNAEIQCNDLIQVKPKLARLKRTLVGTGSGLVLCLALLTGLSRFGAQADAILSKTSFIQTS